MVEEEDYSCIDICFGVAGPKGKGVRAKFLALLCVHRVLWLPWGALSFSTGLFLFMALEGELIALWKIVIGILAAGLLTRVISMADMVYDWYIGEDEELGPPNSTLPLVTGLLSPWTLVFFMIVETTLTLGIAYFVFNLETFIVGTIMLIWGVTYSASPPLKKLTELQRRIYRSVSGFMALGGVAIISPDRVLSIPALLTAGAVVLSCLSYHDKDSLRFDPLSSSQTISFTLVMSILELAFLFGVWIVFRLNWGFYLIYLAINVFKFKKIFESYGSPDSHKTHINLTHVGVMTYTILLLLINFAAIFKIII
ncbi:hypothetical protein C9439_01275 [archaeon SCG-AAA382B04]|nr:hypothetical protein C9439_01275 [archaeon SCG-AAA382B04]